MSFDINFKKTDLFKNLNTNCQKQDNQKLDGDIRRRVKSEVYEISHLNTESEYRDLTVLSNGSLVLTNQNPNEIVVYDQNIEKLSVLRNNNFIIKSSSCIASDNSKDILYIASENSLFKTDLKLNIKEKYNLAKDNCFISSIDFNNNIVYICDLNKKRIIFLHSDRLEYIYTLELYYKPSQIKVENSTICIRSNDFDSIHFYDSLTFKLKNKYYGHCGTISFIGSYFYEFDSQKGKIYWYNSDGIKEDEEIENKILTQIEINNNVAKYLNNGRIINHPESLVILLRDKNNKSFFLRLF